VGPHAVANRGNPLICANGVPQRRLWLEKLRAAMQSRGATADHVGSPRNVLSFFSSSCNNTDQDRSSDTHMVCSEGAAVARSRPGPLGFDFTATLQPDHCQPAKQRPRASDEPAGHHVGWPVHAEIDPAQSNDAAEEHGKA
jgi:hypothetical protein